MEIFKEREGDDIMADRLIFIAKISKAGKNYVIHIPKALVLILKDREYFGRKLKVILEKD